MSRVPVGAFVAFGCCVFKNRKKEKIQTIRQEDLKEETINQEELLQKEEDPEIVFNRLLGKDVRMIFDELREEYVEQGIIDEQSLDMYMRRAITSFQLGERI